MKNNRYVVELTLGDRVFYHTVYNHLSIDSFARDIHGKLGPEIIFDEIKIIRDPKLILLHLIRTQDYTHTSLFDRTVLYPKYVRLTPIVENSHYPWCGTFQVVRWADMDDLFEETDIYWFP